MFSDLFFELNPLNINSRTKNDENECIEGVDQALSG